MCLWYISNQFQATVVAVEEDTMIVEAMVVDVAAVEEATAVAEVVGTS